MDNCDSEGPLEDGWEDRGDLAWNEFDWERYLREQDEAIHRYLGYYEAFGPLSDRIDRVAEQMGWEPTSGPADEAGGAEAAEDEADCDESEVYTLHKNPVFVATKAIMLSLQRPWELLAADPDQVPPAVGVPYLAALHRAEEHAIQALHALDFGDYAMAVSLFKRALSGLNASLALLASGSEEGGRRLRDYCEAARVRLFDLREVWLRVVAECREELDRPVEEGE